MSTRLQYNFLTLPTLASIDPVTTPLPQPSGPLNRDVDDVRRLSDAACAGVQRALAAGARRPLLVSPARVSLPGFEDALLAATLGALHATYVPLEVREARSKFGSTGPKETAKVDSMGIFVEKEAGMWRDGVVELARAIEAGRIVARCVVVVVVAPPSPSLTLKKPSQIGPFCYLGNTL